MAIWNEEGDINPPWQKDSDDLREDLPPELATFLSQLDITRSFTLEVQQFPNETYSGQGQIVDQFRGTIPSYEAIASLHGPQFYLWNFSWLPPGKKKPTHESIKVPLVGAKWESIYREGKRKRSKLEMEKIKMDAEERKAEAGLPMIQTGPNMQDIAALITAVKPAGDSGGTFTLIVGMMQTMAQSQANMMGLMMKAQSDMMIAFMGNQNKAPEKNTLNDFKEIFAMVQQVQSLTGGQLNQKEETLLERIVGGIVDNLDLVKEFLIKSPSGAAAGQGIVGGMIAARPEIKEAATVAKANGLFLKKLVEHLDEQFKDTTITDKALEGFLKVKRPENSLPSEPEGEGESESEG